MLLPYNERVDPGILALPRHSATGNGSGQLPTEERASTKFSPTLQLCPPLTFRSVVRLSLARDAQ